MNPRATRWFWKGDFSIRPGGWGLLSPRTRHWVRGQWQTGVCTDDGTTGPFLDLLFVTSFCNGGFDELALPLDLQFQLLFARVPRVVAMVPIWSVMTDERLDIMPVTAVPILVARVSPWGPVSVARLASTVAWAMLAEL